jgi:hypothetical protein
MMTTDDWWRRIPDRRQILSGMLRVDGVIVTVIAGGAAIRREPVPPDDVDYRRDALGRESRLDDLRRWMVCRPRREPIKPKRHDGFKTNPSRRQPVPMTDADLLAALGKRQPGTPLPPEIREAAVSALVRILRAELRRKRS